MASSINPTNFPAAAPTPPKGPTEVGFMLQDPTVPGAHVDTYTLNLQGTAKPTSDDYTLSVAVAPNKDGKYIFDPKDVKNFLPMTIMANLQRGYDIFSKYCDNTPATWATGQKQLVLHPDDGVDLNAYYNRETYQGIEPGVHFFHDKDRITKETIYSGASGEVTAHEGGPGHALLDRFRPGYFSTWSTDPSAFHESFGDVSSMLVMLKDPKIVDQVIAQTGGDLTKHNVVSDLGEQLGSAINHYVQASGGPKDYTGGTYVRTAINTFKWQDPSTLPSDPPDSDHLSSEAHDWSRLWTGAVYEILGKMTTQNIAAGQAPAQALSAANEDMLKIYGKLISNTAPEGDFTYKDMARAMVKADELTGARWGGLIKNVMADRLILPAEAGMVELDDLPQGSHRVTASFTGNEDAFKGTPLESLGNFTAETLQSGNPLGMTEDDHTEVKNNLKSDLARLAKQGKILFTTPDQQVTGRDLINKQTREPYVGVVKWVDGQATLHRLAIAG